MKRSFAALLAAALLFSVTGCFGKPTEPSQTTPGPDSTETVPTQMQTQPSTTMPTQPSVAPTQPPATEPTEPSTPFDPDGALLWRANCQTYLTLRRTPNSNGDAIGKVKAGDQVTVLGWHEKYALVDYQGKQGYVLSDYLAPGNGWSIAEVLSIVKPTEFYSYNQMQKELLLLRLLQYS